MEGIRPSCIRRRGVAWQQSHCDASVGGSINMPVYSISEGYLQHASQAASTDTTYSYIQVPLIPAVCSCALPHCRV